MYRGRYANDPRISNFLLWQSAYSEFIVLDTLCTMTISIVLITDDALGPDVTADLIDDVLREYSKRHRRFGGLP